MLQNLLEDFAMLMRLMRVLAGLTFLAVLSGQAGAQNAANPATDPRLKTAIFAGGCFWCMEHPFDELEGVTSVTSGYTGGTKATPTYEEVSAGTIGQAGAVQVIFDPATVN